MTMFGSIAKYKKMAQSSHAKSANKTETVNNNRNNTSVNRTGGTSGVNYTSDDNVTYSLLSVEQTGSDFDEKAYNDQVKKENAAIDYSKKTGYSMEIINKYCDYKNGQYSVKSGYQIKTIDEFLGDAAKSFGGIIKKSILSHMKDKIGKECTGGFIVLDAKNNNVIDRYAITKDKEVMQYSP